MRFKNRHRKEMTKYLIDALTKEELERIMNVKPLTREEREALSEGIRNEPSTSRKNPSA